MKIAAYMMLAGWCLFCGCTCEEQPIPITMSDPDVNRLTVTINGATIEDPDGPFAWNWGDGTENTSFFPASHTYANRGFYHITVQVSRRGQVETKDLYLKLGK